MLVERLNLPIAAFTVAVAASWFASTPFDVSKRI
jgi:hypothetical protein